jgi:YfiH family protein
MASPPQIDSPLTVSENGAAWIAVPAWSELDWLWHGFSTRRGGVSGAYLPKNACEDAERELNLGFTASDARENVLENRSRMIEAITGSRSVPCVTARQVHSCRSVKVDELLAETAAAASAHTTYAEDVDGLMTRQPGILIGIQTADCIPVLVADPVKRAVAAFHAGWRGTVERIVEHGVAKMAQEFGSDPADLIAAIGPGIGPCCYTVGDEVWGRFNANFPYAEELFRRSGRELRLNLTEANRRQLLAAGLAAEAIATVGGCTACQPELFYSHRASGGHAGRMMAVIGLR